jgi:hypothetical protein
MRESDSDPWEFVMIVDAFEYNVDRVGWDYKLKEDPSEVKYVPPVWQSNLKRRS